MIKDYYSLTKSGLVFGNVITVIAGFLLAARGVIDPWLLLATVVGISFVMASGCVFNNYIDRDIDARMTRTRDRALVTGRISGRDALIFGSALGVLGFVVLVLYTSLLTVFVGLFGFFFYVFMYSLWFKRRSTWGTVVGSISGAVSPVVGYCAAANRLDIGAVILFAIMVFWQMPHFFAIAIRRADDYASAEVPVLPVKRGIRAAKIQMLFYILALLVVMPLLALLGYTGYAYLAIAVILGLAWLALCIKGFWAKDDKRWARAMFFFSLIVMMGVFITIAVGALFA